MKSDIFLKKIHSIFTPKKIKFTYTLEQLKEHHELLI